MECDLQNDMRLSSWDKEKENDYPHEIKKKKGLSTRDKKKRK